MIRRLILALGAASLIASLSVSVVFAGEITGNGKSKQLEDGGKWGTGLHGRSFCAYPGQEDLQYEDEEGERSRRSPRARRRAPSRGARSPRPCATRSASSASIPDAPVTRTTARRRKAEPAKSQLTKGVDREVGAFVVFGAFVVSGGVVAAVEVGQHGQDAPVVAGVLLEAELREDDADRALDGLGATGRARRRSSGSSDPRRRSARISCSRGVSRPESVARAPRPDQLVDDARVDGRPAGRDATRRVGQLARLAQAVLEQVAVAAGARAEEAQRVLGLEVLRQDEDPDADRRSAPGSRARR